MPSVVGSFVAIKFIQLFTKPFEKWDAYKLGLIDTDGNKLRDAENSKEEKEFVSWKNLIRKLKIILNKVPLGSFGKNLASFAASFWLLKEELDAQGHNGQEIINTLHERIKETYPSEFLAESVNDTDVLGAGRYSIEGTTTLIILKEDLLPVGEVFGTNIFKVEDLVTHEIFSVIASDMVEL